MAFKEIPLSQGKVTIIDGEDYEWLNQWKWYAAQRNDGQYVAVRKPTSGIIRMHRLILNVPKGLLTDHKDGNPLNNQRYNLRICTSYQSQGNIKHRKNTSSKYKGVSWDKTKQKWTAQIVIKHKWYFLGRYESEKDAANAYDKAAIEGFGNFAKPNFLIPNDPNL